MAREHRRESEERGEDGLTEAQHSVIRASRDAMQFVIWNRAKPAERLPLLAVSVTGFFVDSVTASTAAPELVAAMNAQLAGAVLQLVPLARS